MLFDYIPRLYANYLAGCSLWGWRTLPRPPWQWNSWESGGTLLSSDSKRWNRWKCSKMQVVQVIGMSGATAHHLVWQFWKSREHPLLWKQWNRISVNGNVIPLAVKICCSCSYCNIKFPFVLRIWKLEPPTLSFFFFKVTRSLGQKGSFNFPNILKLTLFDRYVTILYFLNEVPAGGETAFPLADNATFDKEVCVICCSHFSLFYRKYFLPSIFFNI